MRSDAARDAAKRGIETARDAVLRDFSEERRLEANRDFFRLLRQRYEITVDETALGGAAARSTRRSSCVHIERRITIPTTGSDARSTRRT